MTHINRQPGFPESPDPIQTHQFMRQKWWLHSLLFVATCISTYLAGVWSSADFGDFFFNSSGLLYSASIMGILLVHEMGHFIAARVHKVDASLPYFIPVPIPPIGTFGAVIHMRRPPRTRTSLTDIGYAGPLAGVVVAVVLCLLGLELSEVRPLAEIPTGGLMEGNSILYLILKKIAHPEMGAHEDVLLHPVAWAGWLGLLVTSLNLLPAGQLDGGHIMYALAGPRKHEKIGQVIHVTVFVMGMMGLACLLALKHDPTAQFLLDAGLIEMIRRGTGMSPWFVWAVLLKFLGGRHPPIQDLDKPLSSGRVALGIIAMLAFILTFTPVFWSTVEP